MSTRPILSMTPDSRRQLLRCALLACTSWVLNHLLRQFVILLSSPLTYWETIGILLISSGGTLLLPALFLARKVGWRNCFRDRTPPPRRHRILWGAFWLSVCLSMNVLLSFLSSLTGSAGSGTSFELDGFALPGMLFAAAAVPAFCEEFTFRGYMMTELSEWHIGASVFLSAFFFGVLHTPGFPMLFAFLIGLLLGWVRHRSGSLFLPMLIHFLNNCFSLLFSAAERSWGGTVFTIVFWSVSAAAVLTALCLLPLVIRARYQDRHIHPQPTEESHER